MTIICPRCLTNILDNTPAHNSVSRRDNETIVCNQCGMEESLVHAQLVDLDKNPKIVERENRMNEIVTRTRPV